MLLFYEEIFLLGKLCPLPSFTALQEVPAPSQNETQSDFLVHLFCNVYY